MTDHDLDRPGTDTTDDEFLDPEDLHVTRDSDGDLLPQKHHIAGHGNVKVIPMTYGHVEEYFGDVQVADVGPELAAEIFEEHVVRPDLSADAGGEVDADYVRDMQPMMPMHLLEAILEESGVNADVEATDDGAQVDLAGN